MAQDDTRATDARNAGWNAESLWQRLEPLLPGLSIEVVARADSTNTQLLDRARLQARGGPAGVNFGRRAGDSQPCLLVAEHQTHGRGRMGRNWQAAPGASLTFSLALALERESLDGLSLTVGVALAEALDPACERVRLKWPNDLMLLDGDDQPRKLGGVLIESMSVGAQRMVVIGVGLNVRPQNIVGELSGGFACVQELDPEAASPAVLSQVAPALAEALCRFERDGFAAFAERFRARDMLVGRTVRTTHPRHPEGVAQGVDATGALLIETPEGVAPLSSGEVSVRLHGDWTVPGGLS